MLPRFLRSRPRRFLPSILKPMEPRRLLSLVINGTPGDDHIVVAFGANFGDVTIRSALGFADGTILHGINGVELNGGDGNDYLEVEVLGLYPFGRSGSSMYTTLSGGNGDDILLGGEEYTRFDGGPGNDQLTGRAADGQAYRSGINYSNLAGPVNVRLDLGTIPNDGYGGHDTVSGIGEIYGTAGNDVIYAGPRNGWYYGGAGDDLMVANVVTGSSMVGQEGNDTMLGGNGSDLLDPGAGKDEVAGGGGVDSIVFYEYEGVNQGVIIRLDRQLVLNDGYGNMDKISGIENVNIYSSFSDIIVGDGTDNMLQSSGGADFVYGGGGNDSLLGGHCSILLGGTGDDYLPSDDRVFFINGGPGADKIELWGYSDSQDVIVPDPKDTVLDHRGATPTPPDQVKPPCLFAPFETPIEAMEAESGSETAIVAPAPKEKKPRRHHKRQSHQKVIGTEFSNPDLRLAARLLSRQS